MAWYRCGVETGSGGGTRIEYIKGTLIANKYIKTDGAEATYNNWSATDYIEVTAGEKINIAAKAENSYNAWYDANKSFLSNYRSSQGWIEQTVPTGAKYLRMSAETSNMAYLQIWRDL